MKKERVGLLKTRFISSGALPASTLPRIILMGFHTHILFVRIAERRVILSPGKKFFPYSGIFGKS